MEFAMAEYFAMIMHLEKRKRRKKGIGGEWRRGGAEERGREESRRKRQQNKEEKKEEEEEEDEGEDKESWLSDSAQLVSLSTRGDTVSWGWDIQVSVGVLRVKSIICFEDLFH